MQMAPTLYPQTVVATNSANPTTFTRDANEVPARELAVRESAPQLAPEPQKAEDMRYRITEIREIRSALERDRKSHQKSARRCQRLLDACTAVEIGSTVTGATVTGIGAVGIITAPIALPIGGTLLAVGVCGRLAARSVTKRLSRHSAIRSLAEAKLDSIRAIVSAALVDRYVSDAEFKLVLEENESYRALKEEIKKKTAPPPTRSHMSDINFPRMADYRIRRHPFALENRQPVNPIVGMPYKYAV